MRSHGVAVTAVAALALASATAIALAPSATAEPATPTVTVLAEAPDPDGATVFVDDPAVLNPHPQSVSSWSRAPRPDAVTVHFTSGLPDCYGVHGEVQETADVVAVKLTSGTNPSAAGRACAMIAVPATVTLPLAAPLGARAVIALT